MIFMYELYFRFAAYLLLRLGISTHLMNIITGLYYNKILVTVDLAIIEYFVQLIKLTFDRIE